MRLNFTFNSFLLNTFYRKVFLVVVLFLFQVVAFSATNTYTGSTTTGGQLLWNTASNWSLGTVPASTDDVVIPSGKTVVLNTSSVSANSITVSGIIEIPADSDVSINSLLIVVTSPSGRIFFNKKSIITLPTNVALYLQNGSSSLDTSDNGVCSNNTEIHVGTTNYAVCTGGNATYTFDQVETAGGINIATAGEIGSSQSLCEGTVPNALTSVTAATGSGTLTYEWETNANGNYVTIGGETSETYSPPVLNTTTSYRRRTVSVINGQTFYSQYTSAVTITVNQASVGGSIAGSTSVCAGTNNTTLTLSGYTGSVVKWQSSNSSSFSSSVTDIANTTTTLTATNLSTSTYYRAVVVNGTCSSANSSIATIAVAANNTVSPASSTSALCFNTAMSNITHTTTGATGIGSAIGLPTGVTASWSSNTITISGTPTQTGTFNYSIPLTGGCGSVNATGVLTVNSLPNNITNGFSATTICAGGSPQLTFDAEDATFSTPYSITYKNDNTSVLYTVSIPSAAPYSFTPGDNPISNTGYTLVSISNATCTRTSGFANPGANLIVRPAPTATVSGTTSVCLGASSPNITFTNPQTVAITITYNINGGTNQTVNVAASSSSSIAASTASAGDFVYNLVSVVYQSTPNCSNTLSGSATVTVNSNSVAPISITGTTTICSGDSTTLTLSGGTAGTGAVAKWYSGSCGGTLLGTGNSISVSPTSTTTYFVRYEGTCNTTSCASATVTVNGNNTVSAASSSPILCVNATMTNVTHTTTGATGIGVASNLPAGVTASWASNTITIAGVPTESGTFNYSVPLTGGCGNVSATGTIIINDLPTTPIAGFPTNPTCTRPTGSVPLSGLPSSGTIIQTGYKEDAYVITPGGTQTISGLLPGTYYFSVSNGSCMSATTEKVEIIAPTTNTWSSGSWSYGTPTINQRLVFSSDYTNANDVDIEGCSCQITGSTIVTIKSGRTLKIENGVEVANTASLIFENNASLVQINEDPSINSGIINYHRYTAAVKRYDFTYWASPVAGQTLKNLSPNTLYDKYYSYDNGWVISYYGAATMIPGRGYLIRAPQTFSITVASVDTNPTFIGIPNNGVVSFAIAGNQVHLLGNPYPSALDADKFLDANAAVLEGTLYFWTHNSAPSSAVAGDATYNYTTSDYATYNRTGGVSTSTGTPSPTGKIAAGQGFFAPASASGGTLTYNNAMRLSSGGGLLNNSQFFKLNTTAKTTTVTSEKSRIWLNLSNAQGAFKQTLVGYISGATNNYDASFDGVTYDGNQFVDFYSVNNAVNLAIQGRALPFVKQDSVTLGYKSTIAGDFQISIDHADGVLETQNVFLEDKTLNVLHDLRKGAYTFTTAKGVFNNRFILRYVDKNAVEEVAAPVASEELSNEVVASVKDGVITVNSIVGALKTVVIYDVSGGILYQKDNVDSNELVIQQLISSHQVLVITIVLSDGTSLSRKVIY